MRTSLNSIASVAALLIVCGCSTSPPVAMTPQELPKAFTAPQSAGVDLTPAWWARFADPELNSLLERARAANLDVAVAAARVAQAQAQAGLAESALLPTVSLSGSARRQGSNLSTVNSFGASATASYELDFWGLNQNRVRAARSSARAAAYDRQVVALMTDATVANTYFSVLALRQRIVVARQNVEAARRILEITKAKAEHGVLSNLELAQQTAQVASQEARIPQLEEQEREQRYALAILLGRIPEGFDVTGSTVENVKAPLVKAGLPAALLVRRPDIAEAEANLLAAHANLDAARAAFLPAISLSGNGGYSSNVLSNLINPGNLAWNAGASLLQTIFDGGQLTSQRDAALAQEQQLVATYRKTVLSALSDVESAIGSTTSLAEQERLTVDEVMNAAEAFRISELQYREGVVDLLTLLQTQQTLFQDQDALIQIKLSRLQASVGLFRVLGGGWELDPDVPTRNAFVPVPDITDLPAGLHL